MCLKVVFAGYITFMIECIQQMCNESWSGIYITTSIQGFSHTDGNDHGQIASLIWTYFPHFKRGIIFLLNLLEGLLLRYESNAKLWWHNYFRYDCLRSISDKRIKQMSMLQKHIVSVGIWNTLLHLRCWVIWWK